MAKKKKNLQWASDSPRYRKFITERDKALEILLNKSRSQMHDVLRGAFTIVKEKIALQFSNVRPMATNIDQGFLIDALDKEITQEFDKAANVVGSIMIKLMMYSYTLSLAGEAEAIGQALDRKTQVQIDKEDVMQSAVMGFGQTAKRIKFAFDKVRRKVLNAVQLSRIEGSNVTDTLARVDRALPAGRFIKRPKKVLKNIKEAGPMSRKSKEDMAVGFYDEELWNGMVQDYLKEFVPTYRFRGPDPDAEYQYVGFEVERDMTHEFVKQVRDASKKGAALNGIEDFGWIAVIDEHTCTECCGDYSCRDFDGKSSTQIDKMTGGEYSVPPAHYNCRCTIAPILEDMPEFPEVDSKEFEEWLNS